MKTYFSQVSGDGISAIATFVLFGKELKEVIKQIFVPKGRDYPVQPDKIHYGLIKYNNCVYDEVILRMVEQSHRFPFFDYAELNVHGSLGIINALKQLFKSIGILELTKQAVVEFGYKSNRINYLQKELYLEIFRTHSSKYTFLLLGEMEKSFIEYIKQNLNNVVELRKTLESLLRKYEIISRFKKPIKVGIFGATNAGKSTLFNCLSNTQRAITSQLAGTTRDYISHTVVYKDFSLELIDTAGIFESDTTDGSRQSQHNNWLCQLGPTDDFINIKAKEITKKLWNSKNILKIVLFSHDAAIPPEIAATLTSDSPDNNTILVYNKIDIKNSGADAEYKTYKGKPHNNVIKISALTNINIDILLEEIKNRIELEQFMALSNPIIFTRRQQILISRLLKLINNNEISKLEFILNQLRNVYAKKTINN